MISTIYKLNSTKPITHVIFRLTANITSQVFYLLQIKCHLEVHINVTQILNMCYFLSLQCSYYPPCKSSRVANEKAVRDYEGRYGKPGQTYPCLYNPKNPTEVIRTRRFHINHVVHGMVWSSLVFVLSLVILILAIRKKGCDFL